MLGIQNYFSFITAIFLFQLFPGAGTIAILNATAKNGAKGGMSAVTGTLIGDFCYMCSAVLGLATILSARPKFLAVTQWTGVCCLCWIGWKFLRVSGKQQRSEPSHKKSNWSFFTQGLAVSLTNPKVIMFFMAFFPLFLNAADSSASTFLIMMLHVTLISLFYQTCLVFVGKAIAEYVSKWKYSKIIALRLAGFSVIGFGIKLASNIK